MEKKSLTLRNRKWHSLPTLFKIVIYFFPQIFLRFLLSFNLNDIITNQKKKIKTDKFRPEVRLAISPLGCRRKDGIMEYQIVVIILQNVNPKSRALIISFFSLPPFLRPRSKGTASAWHYTGALTPRSENPYNYKNVTHPQMFCLKCVLMN